MKRKLIAFTAVAFVFTAVTIITVIINAQPVLAGFCSNPNAAC
jgi:hypothetical protein